MIAAAAQIPADAGTLSLIITATKKVRPFTAPVR
jgi:hypothetical protein